ncbi:hypothetical protein J2849_001149 [Azospirillum melinis]|nr:hypothetical protein [Azospirillum melinis]
MRRMGAKGDDARSRQCHNEIIMPVADFEGEAGPEVKVGTAGWGAEGELDLAKLASAIRP